MVNVEQRVKTIIADNLGISEAQISPDAKFIEDLGADSLGLVEIVMALEEEFGVDIPDEASEKLATYGMVLEYLEDRRKAG